MNWFTKFLHGVARAFTIPAKERKVLNANPLVAVAKAGLALELTTAITQAVGNNIGDPSVAAAATTALLSAVTMTGITK